VRYLDAQTPILASRKRTEPSSRNRAASETSRCYLRDFVRPDYESGARSVNGCHRASAQFRGFPISSPSRCRIGKTGRTSSSRLGCGGSIRGCSKCGPHSRPVPRIRHERGDSLAPIGLGTAIGLLSSSVGDASRVRNGPSLRPVRLSRYLGDLRREFEQARRELVVPGVTLSGSRKDIVNARGGRRHAAALLVSAAAITVGTMAPIAVR